MKIFRTGAILILLTVVLVLAGDAIGGRSGMQMALIFAALINFVSVSYTHLTLPTNREV